MEFWRFTRALVDRTHLFHQGLGDTGCAPPPQSVRLDTAGAFAPSAAPARTARAATRYKRSPTACRAPPTCPREARPAKAPAKVSAVPWIDLRACRQRVPCGCRVPLRAGSLPRPRSRSGRPLPTQRLRARQAAYQRWTARYRLKRTLDEAGPCGGPRPQRASRRNLTCHTSLSHHIHNHCVDAPCFIVCHAHPVRYQPTTCSLAPTACIV